MSYGSLREIWICPPVCEMEHEFEEVAEMFQYGWGAREISRAYGLFPSRISGNRVYYQCQEVQRCAYEVQDLYVGIDYENYRYLSGKRKKRPISVAKREKFERIKRPVVVGGDKGFVYLIQHGENYKIGKAVNVMNRLASLSIIPGEFILLHQFEAQNALVAERTLHKKYEQKRIHREWFVLNAQDISEIRAIKDGDLDERRTTELYELSA